MGIKKNIFAPLSSGLGATRRAAMLLLVMMLTMTAQKAWAQEPWGPPEPGQETSGSCGYNLTWKLTQHDYDNFYTLTIRGEGAMWDYYDPSECPWNSYAEQINEVVIEKDVTSIGVWAFSRCTNLESVTFAEGSQLESIGEDAFNSTVLSSIEIPASVTSIGEYAFSSCYNLESVTFAEGSHLESIGDEAFSDCDYLTSITIPASVTSIGDGAFQNCSNLTSITIPASVTSIGSDVFLNCDLASITVADGNTVYDSRNGCNAIIETLTNTLIIGCKNSTIPASVTSIGESAFYYCTGLTSIEIPASVTSIGAWAFSATTLTSVEIPASVTSIGIRAFLNCRNLTSITIPASVTSIGDYAFGYCLNLATVTVYAPSCSLGVNAFYNCNKLEDIYVFSDLVDGYKSAENWSSYESKITGITGGYCGATGHETDVIWVLTGESPNYTLTISGTGAMADYYSTSNQPWKAYRSSIKTIVIGNGVTSIGDGGAGGGAFRLCDNLATVTFAEGSQLTSIGTSAFKNTGLTSIEIPASVTSIGYNAFISCSNLASMTVADGNTVYDSRNGCNAIIEKSTNTLIIGCKNSTIPDDVTSIGEDAFIGCHGLTSIEIPASVTSICDGAFQSCSGLESISVAPENTIYDSRNGCNAIIEKSTNTLIAGCKNSTIPDGVTSIGKGAFCDCTGLTSIEIPASVTSIGDDAFEGCNKLTSITIPASVTSIGEDAFYGSGLTTVTIPSSVTSIGGHAFLYCSALASVTVYAPSCALGNYAFEECNNLTNIYVFSDLVDGYKAAENWSAYAGKITAIEGIALADNADNSSLITAANGSFLNVTLQGRTLYKDGDWNTLCLPFALSAEQIAASPLAGCTLMELDTEGTYDTDKQTGYDSESGTLYLYFKKAAAIEAGKPYLVKWESGSNITDPVFYGVTVSNEDPENRKAISYDEKVTFRGNYSPVALTGGDASNLYLGAANKLYWPSADCTINAFRGYFHVDLSNGAKVREIRLSLDDNVTSIHNAEFISHNYNEGATYNLSGQKVSDDYKGIVIKNGRKYLK